LRFLGTSAMVGGAGETFATTGASFMSRKSRQLSSRGPGCLGAVTDGFGATGRFATSDLRHIASGSSALIARALSDAAFASGRRAIRQYSNPACTTL
jgi:hypothetical protein